MKGQKNEIAQKYKQLLGNTIQQYKKVVIDIIK